MQEQIITQWKHYGVSIEQDIAGFWSWAETNETGGVNGPFSPPFRSFERCLADLKECFGELAP